MIGRSGERGSGISVLAARHDHDDDDTAVKDHQQTLVRKTHRDVENLNSTEN